MDVLKENNYVKIISFEDEIPTDIFNEE